MIRQVIREVLLESCNRRSYWGRAGSGIIVICQEDNTVLLQRSADGSNWKYPGGGYFRYGEQEKFWYTPIPKKYQISPNDPDLEKSAYRELHEECGLIGLPVVQDLGSIISYQDCGWFYKTFFVSISLEEKEAWEIEPLPKFAHEHSGHAWFDINTFDRDARLFGGMNSLLVSKIKSFGMQKKSRRPTRK